MLRIPSAKIIRSALTASATTLLTLFSAPPALAQDCATYGDYDRWQRNFDTPVAAERCDLAGDLLLIAGGADAGTELLLLDVSDPAAPVLLPAFALPEVALDVIHKGAYGMVANAGEGLQVIDIAAPSAPVIVATVDVGQYVWGLHLIQDYLYLFGPEALSIVDVSDPAAPSWVGDFSAGAHMRAMALSGDTAYALLSEGVWVEVGPGEWDIWWISSLQILDLTSPAAPQVTSEEYTHEPPTSPAYDIAVTGDVVYIAHGGRGVEYFDVSNPLAPALLGALATQADARSVELVGPAGYTCLSHDGVVILDVADPHVPAERAILDTPGYARDLCFGDGHLFVADADEGVAIFAIADPAAPSLATYDEVGVFRLDFPSGGILATSGDRGIYATNDNIFGLDLTDRAAPVISGSLLYAGGNLDIAMSGPIACGIRFGGISVFDVADPMLPQHVGDYDYSFAFGIDVDMAGSLACAAYLAGVVGLSIFDLSVPATPTVLAELPGSYTFLSMTEDLVVAYESGANLVQVIDITTPSAPQIVGSLGLAADVFGVQIHGELAFLGLLDEGFAVLDISDPAAPELIGTLDTPGAARTMAASGPIVYLHDDHAVQVIDVSDPGAPLLRGAISLTAGRIMHVGSHVYLSDSEGLKVVLPDCVEASLLGVSDGGNTPLRADRVQLLGAQPNPFNPLTDIAFTVNRAQNVRLSVFDLTGRRLSILTDRWYDAGVHAVTWDGTDGDGRAVASGNYIARLQAGRHQQARKLTLIR